MGGGSLSINKCIKWILSELTTGFAGLVSQINVFIDAQT